MSSPYRTYVIDGNYMAKRILGVQKDLTFFDATYESDKKAFLQALVYHLSAELRRCTEYVDNVVIVKDHKSWRKSVPVIHQKTDSGEFRSETSYKEGRTLDETRDWGRAFEVFEMFCRKMNSQFNVPYTHVQGAEGDDAIMIWARFNKFLKKRTLVYATDSDLNQLTDNNTVIYRHVRTKLSPHGELIVSKSFWEQYNSNSATIFTNDPVKNIVDANMFHGKEFGKSIFAVDPLMEVFYKMFRGDAKDDVPELFNWGKTEKRRSHVSKEMLWDALKAQNITELTPEHMYDDSVLIGVIEHILNFEAKPRPDIDIDHTLLMLKNNRKLLYLHQKEIPKEVIDALVENVTAQQNMKADMKRLVRTNDVLAAFNILPDSDLFSIFGKDVI